MMHLRYLARLALTVAAVHIAGLAGFSHQLAAQALPEHSRDAGSAVAAIAEDPDKVDRGEADRDEAARTERLRSHVSYLADDALEGRETGTEGERLAYVYIIEAFEALGLQAAGTDGYLHSFDFFAGKSVRDGSLLGIGDQGALVSMTDSIWYPVNFSGEGEVNAPVVDAGFGISHPDHDDYARLGNIDGKILLIDLSVPGGYHPHSDYYDLADPREKAMHAAEKGAAAVIFHTRDPHMNLPLPAYRRTITEMDIPVLVVNQPLNEPTHAHIEIHWDRQHKTGHNVLGQIDNGAPRTVVIGAHYDHLGWGAFGSLHNGEPAIHNGADDNASGVAGLIELARMLSEEGPTSNDYLFIAFSGEELGLFGSKSFTKSDLFGEDNYNYMLNMDMIGRLDSAQRLAVNGVGTSPAWSVLDELLNPDSLSVSSTESGIGASDHTSFYLAGMPALHFFTGTHGDYHRPGDDADKVNFEGIGEVIDFMYMLIIELDDDGKLVYTETKQSPSEQAPSFSVTLGVIPDYMYDGRGMRIESVRAERPAAAAGIEDGDIVVRMGEWEVPDMMGYMKALSKFRKGETVTVTVLRTEEELSFQVTF